MTTAQETRTLRWGFLGTARINSKIIPWLESAENQAAFAVASRGIERAKQYASEWKLPRAFGTYDDLLASPEIDVIYIALPNHMHTEWTLKAIAHGKNVLVEKPLAMSASEVDQIISAADEKKVLVTEGFMYRHHAQTQKLREIIASGRLGKIKKMRATFHISLDRTSDTNIRLDPTKGGGCLWDLGCYMVNLARYAAGTEPKEVSGIMTCGKSGVDETFSARLGFRDYTAELECSFLGPRSESLEVVGTDATMVVARPFKPTASEEIVLKNSSGKIERVPVHDAHDFYYSQLVNFARALRGQENILVSLADSRQNAFVLESLLISARKTFSEQNP